MKNFTPDIKERIEQNMDPTMQEYRNALVEELVKIRNISLETAQVYLEKIQDTQEYQEALEAIKQVRSEAIADKHELKDAQEQFMQSQQKVEELLRKFPDLKDKVENKERKISIEQALEIMGESQFIGPKDIENTFGFSPENVPEVPFSKEELERAKELGQQLILYVDSKEDGSAFTAQAIKEILPKETTDGGTFFYNDWYESDEVTNKETPRAGWRLTTPEVIENSTGKNYLDQTQELVNYVQNKVFEGKNIPKVYQEAIDGFNAQKDTLAELMNSNWQEAAKKLSGLKINQLTRENFTEILYHLAVQEKKSGNKNLASRYSSSNSLDSSGGLMDVGPFAWDGVVVSSNTPDRRNDIFGVCFSRSV